MEWKLRTRSDVGDLWLGLLGAVGREKQERSSSLALWVEAPPWLPVPADVIGHMSSLRSFLSLSSFLSTPSLSPLSAPPDL